MPFLSDNKTSRPSFDHYLHRSGKISQIWQAVYRYQFRNDYPSPRSSFGASVKAYPKELTLSILASRLEEADGKSIKARALLEKALLVNSDNELVWEECVSVEERSRSAAQAKTMLTRALQECPSGLLWPMAIWAEPCGVRKTKAHPLVFYAESIFIG